jgi:hypothetical protein
MDKVVKIGNKEVTLRATASTVRRYRAAFGRDLLVDMQAFTGGQQSGESLEAIEDLMYIMAKQANDKIPDDINEWLDQFDTFDIYQIFPQLFDLWTKNMAGMSIPKKK